MSSNKLFTLQELIHRHPEVILWKWDDKKIGMFFRCLLIDGETFGRNKRKIVTEESFVLLMDYVNENKECNYTNGEFMAYTEVIEVSEYAKACNWTPTIIGNFCTSSLLYGKKCSRESRKLVAKESVIRLLKFTKERYQKKMNPPITL